MKALVWEEEGIGEKWSEEEIPADELISQLEALLGEDTEKLGNEVVYIESIERIKAFFKSHPGTAYDYIQISRDIEDMRLTEIQVVTKELADSRFVQLVASL